MARRMLSVVVLVMVGMRRIRTMLIPPVDLFLRVGETPETPAFRRD